MLTLMLSLTLKDAKLITLTVRCCDTTVDVDVDTNVDVDVVANVDVMLLMMLSNVDVDVVMLTLSVRCYR